MQLMRQKNKGTRGTEKRVLGIKNTNIYEDNNRNEAS